MDTQLDSLELLLLRSALLLGGFWLVWACLRRQPKAQVALCRAATVALLVVPLAGLMPLRPVVSLPVAPVHEWVLPIFAPAAAARPTAAAKNPSVPQSTSHSQFTFFSPVRAIHWLPLLWAAGSLLLLLRWRTAWLVSRRRLLRAAPATPQVEAIADRFARRLDVYARVSVRLTQESSTPVLVGPRPVLLIPHDMADDETDLTCAIAHEFIHVKQNDWWWAQAISGVQALFWPVPLVWPLRRAHDRASEMVCDGLAAPLAGGRETYAGTLARQGLRVLDRQLLAALPMARSLDLRDRIERLLAGLPLPSFTRRQSAMTWLSLLLACALLAAVGLATRPGVVTYRADQSPNQAFGWSGNRLSDVLFSPHSHDQFELTSRDGTKPRTFSGKVVMSGPLTGVEVGLISNVDVQWTNPAAYQWQPVAPDGSFSITDARYLDATKTVVVRGPDTPWTCLGHDFLAKEAARNIILKPARAEHVRLTVSGVDGKPIDNFGCEIFPYVQYDTSGHAMTRQRFGQYNSKSARSVDLVLPPDDIALFCGAPGYARFYQIIDPRKNHAVHLVLDRAGAMRVSVFDAQGRPKTGVRVNWTSDDAPLSYSSGTVGADGTCFAQNLTPSTFDVSVEGYADRRVAIASDEITAVAFRPQVVGAALDQPANPPASAPAPVAAPPAPLPAAGSGSSSDEAKAVVAILSRARDAYAALTSYSDSGTVATRMGTFSQDETFTIRLQRPSLYRIVWTGGTNGGIAWSDGTGDYLRFAGKVDEKEKNREEVLSGATGISSGIAATIPASFFHDQWGAVLSGTGECHLLPDESVDNIPCSVVTSEIHARGAVQKMKIWIGREDHLIRRLEETTSGSPSMPPLDDAAIRSILQKQDKPVTPEAIAAMRTQLNDAQDMAKKMMQGNGIVSTQVHHDIQVNHTFASADFRPEK